MNKGRGQGWARGLVLPLCKVGHPKSGSLCRICRAATNRRHYLKLASRRMIDTVKKGGEFIHGFVDPGTSEGTQVHIRDGSRSAAPPDYDPEAWSVAVHDSRSLNRF